MKRTESIGLASLIAVYALWGSTFLGIRLAVETIPPMIAGLGRHGFGGLTLALGLWLLGRWVMPSRRECRNALFIGALTAGISNGALTWSEVNVPSSYAAISFTTMPLFMLLFNWFAFEKVKPSKFDFVALPLGILGSSLVVLTGESLNGGRIETFDLVLLVVCPSVWAFGSLLGRRIAMPKNILVSSAFQMVGGAILLAMISVAHGDWVSFRLAGVSERSLYGILYLAIGGSLFGYTAFAIAIKSLDSRFVGTFAFVNPIIAVGLGYFFGEDVAQASVAVGAGLSVMAVVLTFVGARYRR